MYFEMAAHAYKYLLIYIYCLLKKKKQKYKPMRFFPICLLLLIVQMEVCLSFIHLLTEETNRSYPVCKQTKGLDGLAHLCYLHAYVSKKTTLQKVSGNALSIQSVAL
jgi:hypothetical protein